MFEDTPETGRMALSGGILGLSIVGVFQCVA